MRYDEFCRRARQSAPRPGVGADGDRRSLYADRIRADVRREPQRVAIANECANDRGCCCRRDDRRELTSTPGGTVLGARRAVTVHLVHHGPDRNARTSRSSGRWPDRKSPSATAATSTATARGKPKQPSRSAEVEYAGARPQTAGSNCRTGGPKRLGMRRPGEPGPSGPPQSRSGPEREQQRATGGHACAEATATAANKQRVQRGEVA